MKNLNKTASDYVVNNIDDENVCYINNHWEDFLEGKELQKVKNIEKFLERIEDENEGYYVAPQLINMYIVEYGDVVVAGNENWAHKYFDGDTKMSDIINYLVEQLNDEKDKVLSRFDIDGYNYLDDYFTNLKSVEDGWEECLALSNVSAEEYTLEEYARDTGYKTIEEYLD